MFNFGLVLLFLYNVLTAAKGVYLGSFLQRVPPFLVLTVCFSLVTLFFLLIDRVLDGEIKIFRNFRVFKKQIIALNVSALVGWTGFYYALKWMEPAIVTSITSASGPILTAVYYAIFRSQRKIRLREWIIYSSIALTMAFLGGLS